MIVECKIDGFLDGALCLCATQEIAVHDRPGRADDAEGFGNLRALVDVGLVLFLERQNRGKQTGAERAFEVREEVELHGAAGEPSLGWKGLTGGTGLSPGPGGFFAPFMISA
jgi:hypothetical protein